MTTVEGALILFGRVVGSIVFANSALHMLRKPRHFVEIAKAARMPLPLLAGIPSGIWLAVGTISVVLGIWPDLGCLMLAIFVVPATPYFHAFWRQPDPVKRQADRLAFLRNVNWFAVYVALAAIFTHFDDQLPFAVTGSFF